jgi:hypothetical protein
MTVLPPDPLNSIGVLTRREIEARLLIPLIEALSAEFGRERVLEVVQQTIMEIARQQGANLAENHLTNDLASFARATEAWKKGDALVMKVLEQSERCFSYDVHRCRYAEMYQDLGAPELGRLLSCSRDFALVEGFNPAIELSRTQTIMEGAETCDFRYHLEV